MNCTSCGKYPFCEDINESGCNKWLKRSYDTKLVKVEGLNYKFERIKNNGKSNNNTII